MESNQTKMTCPHCQTGWEIRQQDRFCGICGTQVFGYDVRWADDNPILYAQKKGTAAKQRWMLILENCGLLPVKFDKIVCEPDDAIKVQTDVAGVELDRGEEKQVSVSIDTSRLPTGKGNVVVRVKDQKKSLPIDVQPAPQFDLAPSVATVAMQKDKTQETIQLNLLVLEGKFQIESVSSDETFVREVMFDGDVWIHPGSQVPIHLDVDCSVETGVQREVTLVFKLKWLEQSIEKQIKIVPSLLPQLECTQYGEIKVLQGDISTYPLKIRNVGGEPLVLHHLAVSHQDAEANMFFPLPPESSLELAIPPGNTLPADLPLDVRNCPPGEYVIQIDITSNCCKSPRFSHQLRATVKELVEYNDYIAFDFGTTNSCVAYFDENSEIQLITVDPVIDSVTQEVINTGEIFPSTILYRDTGKGKDYVVGRQADNERASLRDRPYYVASAKRALGYKWHRRFPIGIGTQRQPLAPREVVFDIITAFQKKAEQALQKKIMRCVVTHPTLFSRRQLEDLRWAFEQWFVKQRGSVEEDTICFIDEASAASLDYIYQRKQQRKNQDETYHILIYDFGGGTIDMVLNRVVVERGQLTVEPLTSGGNPRFGGDDVTESVVEWIVDSCCELLKEHFGKDARVLIPWMKRNRNLPDTTDPELARAIEANSSELDYHANNIKLDLTTLNESGAPVANLRYVIAGSQYPQSIETVIKDMRVSMKREQFNDLIRPELEKTLEKIDRMIQEVDTVPDVIILAGQSSQIPLVKELIQNHFNQRKNRQHRVEISRARDSKELKACVAWGAVRYGTILSSPTVGEGEHLEIANFTNKTHARFGIRITLDGKPRFYEFIERGTPIKGPIRETRRLNLTTPITRFGVYEHFGSGEEIKKDEAEEIGEYTVTFPPHLHEEALHQVLVEMIYTVNGSIKLSVDVEGKKYHFECQRKYPPLSNDER